VREIDNKSNDLGCIGSWLILLIIGIVFSVVGFISDSFENFKEYILKENGVIGGALIIAFLPISIIILFTIIYNKTNKK
jgi:hypothetical protein